MPVLTLGKNQHGIDLFNGAAEVGEPAALRNTFLFDTHGHGVPRRENLIAVRTLEDTHPVRTAMDSIKTQVSGTPWTIRPTVDNPTSTHRDAADDLTAWLEGNFNQNEERFNHFLRKWVGDILSIDAGVVELVPEADGGPVREVYARDGATFVKAPDKHGRLPTPESEEPAYWQHSMANVLRRWPSQNSALADVLREFRSPSIAGRPREPVAFNRDQLRWAEANPQTKSVYGLGRVQVARRIVEILLNEDHTNLKRFTADQIPEGIMALAEASKQQITQVREYWADEVEGEEYKLPIVNHDVEWIPFRPSLEDLQFLESQRWYHKLVWMVFGLSESEVGLEESSNRATSAAQRHIVFRRTTKPLLNLLADEVNAILRFHEAWQRVNGELEFAFQPEDPIIAAEREERQIRDLNAGVRTINEVRQERGLEELAWGDMPLSLVESLSRGNPGWMIDEILELEVDELPSTGPPGGMGLLSERPENDRAVQPSTHATPGVSFEEALEWSPQEVKEALRNTREWPGPPVKQRVDALTRDVAKTYAEIRDDVQDQVEDAFPSEKALADTPQYQKLLSSDISQVLGTVQIADRLLGVVREHISETAQDSAEHHARDLEQALEEAREEDEPEVVFEVPDIQDSRAFRQMEAEAAQRMTTVEGTVKERIRDTLVDVAEDGGNVSEATEALDDRFDQLSRSHSRLVARTETLDASRTGSQGLAEESDVVGGKMWRATPDDRTRTWHKVMDEEVVPVDQSFTVPDVSGQTKEDEYQPRDYPREAFKVGDDQPFRCRCSQDPVLSDEVEWETLAHDATIRRKHPPAYDEGLTPRQREVLFRHGRPDEGFRDLLTRLDGAGSRRQVRQTLGLGSGTLYRWLEDYDLA